MSTGFMRKFDQLDDNQLDGMIAHTHRTFAFLESTSVEALRGLSRLMLHVDFIFDKKPTPVRSAYEFLKKVSETDMQGKPTESVRFAERDFVFVVKMFGLRIRVAPSGVNQFVADNELDSDDEELPLDGQKAVRELEFYLSDVYKKRTKIQTHSIQSATNKLLREWREVRLAKVFADKIAAEGLTIGQAREHLRDDYMVKDHEFVRIRQHAMDRGWFTGKRNQKSPNRRVTLEEDNVEFVETLSKNFAKGKTPLSPSATVNKALRDFKLIIEQQNGVGPTGRSGR